MSIPISQISISREWDYDKNINLSPDDLTYGSHTIVWWKCPKGHSWQDAVHHRTFDKRGCPYCSGKRIIKGENDLKTRFPAIAATWDQNANDITPEEIHAFSNKKVFWTCNKGHKWQAPVCDRVKGSGCPYCASKRSIKGVNDLATVLPLLVEEWDYALNNNLNPADFLSTSHKIVWWKCNKGHSFKSEIRNRASGSSCPYCSGRLPIKGKNDLKSLYPHLAEEWTQDRNNNGPEHYLPQSNTKVWWKCSRGHEWQAKIYSRVNGRGCPYCSGRRPIKGINDLATVRPDLVTEWHPTKNGKLKTYDVSSMSNQKVWWLGQCGHEWKASVDHRSSGTGCPYCANNYMNISKKHTRG